MISSYYLQIACTFGIGAIMALGLNLITGVAGQLSLGHAAFMSLGAYASALMTIRAGAPFAVSLAVGTIVAGFFGLLIGFPTLRLKGDYLAIATLGFGEITRVVLLNMPAVGGALGLSGIPTLTNIWIVMALLVLVILGMARLQNSRPGRAWLAIREDETAAEAMGIDASRWKVAAFMVGAAMAGLGGGLYAHMLTYISPSDFNFMKSIEILNMVVLGGMGSIPGVVIGSAILSAAPEFLRFMRDYRMMFYGALLVFMMIFRPEGLWGKSVGRRLLFEGVVGRLRKRGGRAPASSLNIPSPACDLKRARKPRADGILLHLEDMTVAFGGLLALSDINLHVQSGEILGLIGPNGAGKTTLFNAVGGLYTPTGGRVLLGDRDVTGFSTWRMAEVGVSRTFQNIRLFGDLTVLENVKVACHIRTRTGLGGALLRLPGPLREEAWVEQEARRLLDHVGLGDRAGDEARSLPYGEQRRLEIARALGTNPQLLLLDEPAAGMNPQETTALMEVIRRIRDLGVTVFLVEHDMHLVTGVCDRVVVLDYGRKIAEGIPAVVTRDPAVIAAYLGADDALAEG